VPIRVDEVGNPQCGTRVRRPRVVLLGELVAGEDQRPAFVHGLRIALELSIERFDVFRIGAGDEVEKVHAFKNAISSSLTRSGFSWCRKWPASGRTTFFRPFGNSASIPAS